uniref:Uncharacterized protein n=1 Tax=Schizaphis graminum TaxID=13262 RepID=A0A2S2NB56_SCHGA
MHSMNLLTSFRKCFTLINAIVLLITCVFNFVLSPLVLWLLNGNCAGVTFTSMQGMYSRMIAVACFLSLSTLLCKYCTMMRKTLKPKRCTRLTTDKEHRNHSLFFLLLTVIGVIPLNFSRCKAFIGPIIKKTN